MAQHLISEPLRPIPCPCGAWTLAGHTGGLYVRVDPATLSERDELTALLTGRHTYDLHTEAYRHGLFLEWRDAEAIAATRTRPVLTQHRCGQPLGTTATPRPPPAAPRQPNPTRPPY